MRCIVPFCRNSHTDTGVAFYVVTEKRYEPWMKAIGRPLDDPPVYNRRICSEHFATDCYTRKKATKPIIKDDAIPTLKLKPSLNNFPSDLGRRKIWFALLGFSANKLLPKHAEVCSDHFLQSDFLYKKNGVKYLKPESNPKPTSPDVFQDDISIRSFKEIGKVKQPIRILPANTSPNPIFTPLLIKGNINNASVGPFNEIGQVKQPIILLPSNTPPNTILFSAFNKGNIDNASTSNSTPKSALICNICNLPSDSLYRIDDKDVATKEWLKLKIPNCSNVNFDGDMYFCSKHVNPTDSIIKQPNILNKNIKLEDINECIDISSTENSKEDTLEKEVQLERMSFRYVTLKTINENDFTSDWAAEKAYRMAQETLRKKAIKLKELKKIHKKLQIKYEKLRLLKKYELLELNIRKSRNTSIDE